MDIPRLLSKLQLAQLRPSCEHSVCDRLWKCQKILFLCVLLFFPDPTITFRINNIKWNGAPMLAHSHIHHAIDKYKQTFRFFSKLTVHIQQMVNGMEATDFSVSMHCTIQTNAEPASICSYCVYNARAYTDSFKWSFFRRAVVVITIIVVAVAAAAFRSSIIKCVRVSAVELRET